MNEIQPRRYARSEALLNAALDIIPIGAQTFSKSVTQYPRGAAPFFIDRATGSKTWDVDGNEYIDFNNALCAVTLGHCDPDVTAAVSDQLKKGTIFSLSSALEIDVARLIVDLVPCAQSVRFGKNGSDATAGAVRAARAFTGRDHIAVCGYHGWQDWYIGSTARRKGVPLASQGLTHSFPYNDAEALDAMLTSRAGAFAAVILEPMNVEWPQPGYLQAVVDIARSHGAVAIFDETITGFRYALGGAQEYFGVTPDLVCLGKGLANGYPLAAVAGRADVMREFEDVFFSFTMGGETLSLAAAKASLEKSCRENIPAKLAATGTRILEGVRERIERHGCTAFLSVVGHPSWSFLVIHEQAGAYGLEMKTLFMQEILVRGILTLGTHNVSWAHDDADVDALLDAYDQVFPLMRDALATGTVRDRLRCDTLQPLFKIR